MKILIVSDIPTSPVNAGNRKLIAAYTSLFKRWGHEVHFLYVYRHNLRKRYRMEAKNSIPITRKEWGSLFHQYDYSLLENLRANMNIIKSKLFRDDYRKVDEIYPAGLSKEILRLHGLHHFDALLVNYFYLSKALEAIPIKRKALFTHDSFSLHQKGKGYKAAYYLKEEEETKALRRAPYIFAMQDVEAEYFHKLAPNAKILINYSHYDFHEQPVIGNHNLLYLSGASAFNLQGLSWFIEKVLPKIRLEFPNARLCIGGGICKMLSDFNKPDYIEIVGYVDDPYDFFMKGDVAINPCQVGTGLKIKTFEAISYDKVTMVHPHSLIGVYKKGEVPVFASSRAEDWVTYLRKAWHEPEFISSIKTRNRQYINDMDRFVEGEYKTWLF